MALKSRMRKAQNKHPTTIVGRDGKRYPHWSRTPLFVDLSGTIKADDPEREAFIASLPSPKYYGLSKKRVRFRLTHEEKLHVIKRRIGQA